jgi:hypothetical protein
MENCSTFGGGLNGEASFPLFFMKSIRQTEAVHHINGLLRERGFNMTPRHLGSQRWVIFEHQGKQIGVDAAAGVWVREDESSAWRCLAIPCTVSGAIQAVEFLTANRPARSF